MRPFGALTVEIWFTQRREGAKMPAPVPTSGHDEHGAFAVRVTLKYYL
jgi:hypothetical protein